MVQVKTWGEDSKPNTIYLVSRARVRDNTLPGRLEQTGQYGRISFANYHPLIPSARIYPEVSVVS